MGQALPALLGRLLCLIGIHDFHVIDATFAFGASGSIARMECSRCGRVTTRRT